MKVGFFFNHIGNNQIAFDIISNINKSIKENDNATYHIFAETIEELIKPPSCPIMQSLELYAYNAPVISTSLQTANKLLHCVSPIKKYLFLHSTEWFNNNVTQYEHLHQVLMHPSLKIIAINEDYKTLFESCFNKQVDFVWENFNMKLLLEKIK